MPDHAHSSAPGRRWQIAAVVALTVVAFAGSLSYVWNFDAFAHLASGDWMLRNLRVLGHDPFSIDPEPEWVNVHWLFQVLVAALHAVGGFAALSVLKACLAAAMALVFALALRRHVAPAWLLVCGLALLAVSSGRIRVRPEAVTLLFLMVTVAVVDAVRRGGTPRRLWWLVPLMLLWVNMHGLYILGLGIIWGGLIGAWADRRLGRGALAGRLPTREALAPILAATVACLVSPWPFRAAAHPILLWTRISGEAFYYTYGVAELAPTWQRLGMVSDIVLLVALVAVAMIANARRLPTGHVLWLGAFVGLAAMAFRNVGLIGPVCAFLLALHGGAVIRRIGERHPRAARAGPAAAAVMLLLAAAMAAGYATETIYYWRASHLRFGAGLDRTNYPLGIARWLAEVDVRGEVFCDNFGDASVFMYYFGQGRHTPRRRIFMDGRLEAHSLERFVDQNRLRQQFRTVTLAEKVPLPPAVRFVVIRGDGTERLGAMMRSDRFRLVRIDEVAACFEDARWLSASPASRGPADVLRRPPGQAFLANVEDFDVPLLPDGTLAGREAPTRRWWRRNPPNVPYKVGAMLLYLGQEDEVRGAERLDPLRQRLTVLAIRYLTAGLADDPERARIVRGTLAIAHQQRAAQGGFELSDRLPVDVHASRALRLYRELDLGDLEDPRMLMFALYHVRALLQSHQFDAADRAVRAIMEHLPPSQRVNPPLRYLHLRGTVVEELDRVEAKLAARGLAADDTSPPARAAGRARVLVAPDIGLIDRAVDTLRRAPGDAEAQLLLADLLLRRGEPDEARRALDRADALAPQAGWQIDLRRALSDWVAGRTFSAADALDRLAQQTNRPLVRYYQAMVHHELGRYGEARAAAAQLAAAAETGPPDVRYLHGLLLMRMGEHAAAREEFRRLKTEDATLEALVAFALRRVGG